MNLIPVIGLEIHAELSTKEKLFCSCSAAFGAAINQNTCPVCLGQKDARPHLNPEAVMLALRGALALGCDIQPVSAFDRKHYTYPDLPKGYQITQFHHPIALGGSINVDGKTFPLTRIHIEEDAGKILRSENSITVDFNRCGVPLIEIVTEPVFASGKEASDFCRELRRILLFAEVCDGKMNEGSMRFDVNLSLHEPETPLGTRTEIKNLNSFRFLEKAISAEIARQTEILESGGKIERQTLRYDEKTSLTRPMRDKEESEDYDYRPEPDLAPLNLAEEQIETERAALPRDYRTAFAPYSLKKEQFDRILTSKARAELFDACLKEVSPADHPAAKTLFDRIPDGKTLPPRRFAALASLLGSGKITQRDALDMLSALCEGGDFDPLQCAERNGALLTTDTSCLHEPIRALLREHGDKVDDYLSGNTALIGFFMGQIKKTLQTPIAPSLLRQAIEKALNESRNEEPINE